MRRIVKSLIVLLLGITAWWALTDARVMTWPEATQLIFARGAIEDYLEVRCIGPRDVKFVGNHSKMPMVGGAYVSAYSGQAEFVTVWQIKGRSADYPVMVSVFPDANYAVNWWYDLEDGTKVDSYVSSTLWEGSWATLREPIEANILEESNMPRHRTCGGKGS